MVLILSVLTILGFWGGVWWVFDVTSHFRVQYFILLTIFALLSALGRRPQQTVIAIVFALVNFFQVSSFSVSESIASPQESNTIRILKVNLRDDNSDFEKVRALIRETNADLVLVEEYNKTWRKELKGVLSYYAYEIISHRHDGWGIGLFSRLPFIESEIRHIGNSAIPTVYARIDTGNKIFAFIGAHLQDPLYATRTYIRNRQLQDLAIKLNEEKFPVMVLGDLNTSPWSPNFENLIRKTKVQHPGKGLWIQPTWPTYFFPLQIPLDHCLTSPDILIHKINLGTNIGSDHFPLIADFSIG